MVFSFFKKKEAEPAPASKPRIVQPKKADASADAATPPVTDNSLVSANGAISMLDFSTVSEPIIEVSESSDVMSAAMEQAAILFANDQNEAAVQTLAAEIGTVEGHHALDTWLMLFDLYQIQNQKAEFDALALQFVVEFERSAPVWLGGKPVVKAAAKTVGGSSILPENLTLASLAKPFAEFDKAIATGKGASLRCDFGKVKEIDHHAAQALLDRCQQLKKKGVKLSAVNAGPFAALLQGKVEVMRSDTADVPFWLLLIELHQLLGLIEEFENLAVDYAVTYEVSPPSWDASQAQKTAAEVAAEQARLQAEAEQARLQAEAEAENEGGSDGFVVPSALLGAAESQFVDLLSYAHEHQEVRIDFSACPRVDFVSAGALLNVLLQIAASGKPIQISGANEPMAALFKIMGITDVARVIRKK